MAEEAVTGRLVAGATPNVHGRLVRHDQPVFGSPVQQLADVVPAAFAQSWAAAGGDVFHCFCVATTVAHSFTHELSKRT